MRLARCAWGRRESAARLLTGGLILCAVLAGCASAVPVPVSDVLGPSTTDETAKLPPPSGGHDRAPSWSSLVRTGRESLRAGALNQAESDFTEAYRIATGFRPRDPRTQATINNLGRTARAYLEANRADDFAHAMELLSEISDRVASARTVELAQLLTALGSTLGVQERYDEATTAFEQARTIVIELRGTRHPSLAGIQSQLALMLIETDELVDARTYIEDALEIAEEAAGLQSALYARGLLARARLQTAELHPEEAEGDVRAAVDIHRAVFGERSGPTAAVVRELALFYEKAGRDTDAEAQYARVIEIWDTLPHEAYQRAASRNELAWFLVSTGRADRAEEIARSALEIVDAAAIRGQSGAAVADTLATALRDQEKYDEAESLYQRAMRDGAHARKLPGWDPSTIREHYAELLRKTGRDTEADDLLATLAAATGPTD